MIDPIGEARPNYRILAELAERLGYGHLYPPSEQAMLAFLLEAGGHTLEELAAAEKQVIRKETGELEYRKWELGLLRADGQPGFETPSGKFEIKSTILEQYGYPGLPEYEESPETPLSAPQMLKRYPLILGTGPFKPDMKSCFRAIPGFIKRYPHPVVEMNAGDAEARGIANGDAVVIKTARGSVTMQAHVSDRIMPDVVYAMVGGGGPQGPEAWQQANANALTDFDQYDDISGFPVYKTLLCQVKKKKRRRRKIAVQDPSLGCVG